MADRIRKLRALTGRFGWKQTIEVVLLWAAKRLFRYRRAIVYSLDLERLPTLPECDQFEWSYKNPGEVDPAFTPEPEPADTPWATDRRYFIGSVDGVQCYSSAVSCRGFRIPDRVTVAFPGATEAYVGDCVTLDAYRGMGLYPCGLVQLASRLGAEGKGRLYLFVERDNLASIRGVRKAGFLPVAACSVLRCGRMSRRRWRFLASDAAGLARNWKIQVHPS